MPKQLFIEEWNQFHLSSHALQSTLKQNLKLRHLKKGEVLYHQDERIHKMYFIVKGFFLGRRVEHGKDGVCWFLKERHFIKDHDSLYQQKPAKHTVTAMEDSTLLYLSYQDLEMINEHYPEANVIAKKLLAHYLAYHQKRTSLLTIGNSTERFHCFIKEFPWALARLKRGDIASFLNMSAETLSRIR